MTEYRECLISTVRHMLHTQHDLFGEALNLAMAGPYKDIDDAFEVGDVYNFGFEHLENSGDANLEKIATLMKLSQETIASMININALSRKELGIENDDRF